MKNDYANQMQNFAQRVDLLVNRTNEFFRSAIALPGWEKFAEAVRVDVEIQTVEQFAYLVHLYGSDDTGRWIYSADTDETPNCIRYTNFSDVNIRFWVPGDLEPDAMSYIKFLKDGPATSFEDIRQVCEHIIGPQEPPF